MTNKLKYSMIFGSSIMNLAFGFTNPTMVIYFTSRVDPGIYAIANMITLGLGALVNNSINVDRIMKIYKQYFVYIVIADLIGSAIIYSFAIDHVAFRYIAFAITKFFVNLHPELRYGVMVALQILVLSVEVRILLSQLIIFLLLSNLPR